MREAERACEAVLERSPDDVEALNVVALASVRDGKPFRAVALLERATRIDPENPVSFFHLGRAHETLGNLAAAVSSLSDAVRLKPDFYLARLHYASMLERTGEVQRSVFQFARALNDAQAQGRWLNTETTQPGLLELVRHAAQMVRGQRRALLFGIAERLAAKYGSSTMTRVEKCLRVYLQEEQVPLPDPRQAPTFLYFPDLPTTAYFDRSLFPWIPEFEAQTDAIREELLALLPSEQGRERVFTGDEIEQQNLRGGDVPPTWNGYYFYRHGVRREKRRERGQESRRSARGGRVGRGHMPREIEDADRFQGSVHCEASSESKPGMIASSPGLQESAVTPRAATPH